MSDPALGVLPLLRENPLFKDLDPGSLHALARNVSPLDLERLAGLRARLRSDANDLDSGALGEAPSLSTPPRASVAEAETAAKGRDVLRQLPLFQGFEPEELDALLSGMHERRLPRGHVLFEEGQPASSCFLIVRGAVELGIQRGERRSRLSLIGPGRLFGELSLIDGSPRRATSQIREEAVLLELDRAALLELLAGPTRAGLKLLEAVSRRVERAEPRPDRIPVATKARAQQLIEKIRESVIGDDVVIEGPFGHRRLVYADYTASGRSLSFIEDFLRREVLPFYANTHTEASGTGEQTTHLREDARRIVRDCVGGGEDDVVVFAGSGCTGAIDKLIHVMNLRIPRDLDARYHLSDHIPQGERPVVFIGPYEHHSNLLSWRESICEVVEIGEDEDGRIDVDELERALIQHADRPLKIGSFSAASNVTGILSDTARIAAVLHRHGALSFWDYAAAGPYLDIDMNPQVPGVDPALVRKDAVFISPHKFIGGPGTPGILVAKRHLFQNKVPAIPGGGTVMFVTSVNHRYSEDPAHREEAGTPAIIESIRAGLVFQLKRAVGVETIREREERFVRRAIEAWQKEPNLRILGNPDLERLSIVSFLVRRERGYLHWNYVVSLLNDLFGIQARGGCSCAGPYGQRLLLEANMDRVRAFEAVVGRGFEGMKPGWTRVNFNYFISETVFDYIVRAVSLIARSGHRLLPLYRFDPLTGQWRHAEHRSRPIISLFDVSYESGTMEFHGVRSNEPESVLERYYEAAVQLLERGPEDAELTGVADPPLPEACMLLRHFPLPGEVASSIARERGLKLPLTEQLTEMIQLETTLPHRPAI